MIRGKEFISCESDFIEFVKQDIKQGGFNSLLDYAGLCMDELINGLDMTELYDYDYLETDSELCVAQIFLDKSIREAVLRELKIIEVFTIPIQRKAANHRVIFTTVGESQMPEAPYICYAYGFIDCTEGLTPRYYFHCLAEIAD